MPKVAKSAKTTAPTPRMRGTLFAHCGKTCANERSRYREVTFTLRLRFAWPRKPGRRISICRGLSRQREGDERVVERRDRQAVAAGADQHVLAPVWAPVGHRPRPRAGGQLVLPQLLAGLDVEGTEAAVDGAADEHQPAGGRDGAAERDGAEVRRRRPGGTERRRL